MCSSDLLIEKLLGEGCDAGRGVAASAVLRGRVDVVDAHNATRATRTSRHGNRPRVFPDEEAALTDSLKRFDIIATASGGGVSGQAGAMRHGIARALILADASLRPILKKNGFLTRDPRMKERKKYGQPGARKRFQFSKR